MTQGNDNLAKGAAIVGLSCVVIAFYFFGWAADISGMWVGQAFGLAALICLAVMNRSQTPLPWIDDAQLTAEDQVIYRKLVHRRQLFIGLIAVDAVAAAIPPILRIFEVPIGLWGQAGIAAAGVVALICGLGMLQYRKGYMALARRAPVIKTA